MTATELRPMPPSTLERLVIDGPAGALETDLNDPGLPRRGIALIAHPNPVQGGTKDNKVVTTLAKTLFGLGYVAIRPNFRGVGASAGVFDQGNGETDDLVAVIRYAKARFGELPLLLAGFSFGAFVQTRVAQQVTAERLVRYSTGRGRSTCRWSSFPAANTFFMAACICSRRSCACIAHEPGIPSHRNGTAQVLRRE